MAKLNGTDVDLDDELAVGIRDNLLRKGHIVKRDDEYFWTMKNFKDLERSLIRLKRSCYNPFWKFYYSFFKW